MSAKFIAVLLILSLSHCQCGLFDWFNEWTEQLQNHNVGTKCRERRDARENGIKPEITNPAQGEMVSLTDIEEARPTDETGTRVNPKTKRCPKDIFKRLVGKSILGMPQANSGSLPLVKRDLDEVDEVDELDEELCSRCTRDPTCILLKQCEKCKKYCGFIPAFVNDAPMLQDKQTVQQSNRMASIQTKPKKKSKMMHQVGSYKNELKNIICRIIGITDTNDIDSIIIFATTLSNKQPEIRHTDRTFDMHESNSRGEEDKEKEVTQDELPTENMPYSSDKNRKPSSLKLKPRFNDYDSGEDFHTFSKLRSLEPSAKANPDLIEGPPPFVRSSQNHNEKQHQMAETTTMNRDFSNAEDSMVGATNKEVLTQPLELISDESDEDEILPVSVPVQTDAPVSKPSIFSKLRNIKDSRTKQLQRLKSLHQANDDAEGPTVRSTSGETHIFTSTPPAANSLIPLSHIKLPTENDDAAEAQNVEPATTEISGISKALEDVKAIVKNIQEEAQRASGKRILGVSDIAGTPSDIISRSQGAFQSVIPPEVIDNVKDVNKYLINRAQDALETVGHPQDDVKSSNEERDHHSVITKQAILGAKKVPEYFLEKVQNSINHLEKKLSAAKAFNDANDKMEDLLKTQDQQTQFGTKNNDISSMGTATENEGIVGFTEPADALTDIPTTNQYKTKLEKYLEDLKNRRQKLYSPEKFKEVSPVTQATKENFNQTSRVSELLKSPNEIEQRKQILRNRLKNYIDNMLSRRTTIEASPENSTKNSLLGMEEEVTSDYFGATPFNLSGQTDQNVNDDQEEGTTEALISEAASTGQLIEQSAPSLRSRSKDLNHFVPTLPSATRNPLKKYIEDLRAKSQVKALGSKAPDFDSRFGSDVEPVTEDNLNEREKMMKMYQSTVVEPRKKALKEQLKNYMDSLKKPMESRMSRPTNPGQEAGSAVQRNELVKKLMDELRKKTAKTISTPENIFESKVAAEAPSNQEESTVNISTPSDEDSFGDREHVDEETMTVGARQPSSNEMEGKRNADMEIRANFDKEEDGKDWQSNLGKIVQYSSKPEDIFFSGNGIKLPMKLKLNEGGSMDLAVDLEKLCSCKNSTCSKNHTEIEETVGVILEKEAELENQLNDASSAGPASLKNYHTKPNGIFKRSSELGAKPETTMSKNVLESTKENINKQIVSLSKLPTVKDVASDLSDFNKQLQKEFADSLHEMHNNAAVLNNEKLDTLTMTHPNMETLETQLGKFKDLSDQNMKQVLKSAQHNSLTVATQNPLIATEEYIKKLEREKTLKKLLRQMHLPTISSEVGLKQLENQAKAFTQNMEHQYKINNLKNHISGNQLKMAKLWTTQNPLEIADQFQKNLKSALPDISKLQNRITDINDNLLKMPDVFQNSKINALENELQKLNNAIEKYEESNEKLFAGESKRFFGGHNNKVIQKEVSLIGKTLSWLNSLTKSDK